jgi:hypothetical protein
MPWGTGNRDPGYGKNHPGSRGQKCTGSWIRVRYTVYKTSSNMYFNVGQPDFNPKKINPDTKQWFTFLNTLYRYGIMGNL